MSNSQKKSRIGFGSCSSQHYEQIIWPAIKFRNLSAFVWGGDAIYADSKTPFSFRKDPEGGQATPEILRKLYQEQLQDPGYKSLLDTKIPILGTLDDHDYGINNGDRTYRYRTESGTAFACDFLKLEGTAMCDRAKKGRGVYGVKVMDFHRTQGNELLSDEEAGLDPDVVADFKAANITRLLSDRSVAIYILDVRTNRTPTTKKGFDSYDFHGDFLGEEQFLWFEEAIRRSSAAVNIVVQGLQVHADRVATAEVELWSNFPTSQHRLYQALLQDNVRAPIIVSGDMHQAQLLRKDCRGVDSDKQVWKHTKPLLEVTTSGMTHAWGAKEHLCARPSSIPICSMTHFKLAGRMAMTLAYWLNAKYAWTDLIELPPGTEQYRIPEEGKDGMQFVMDLNFGELEFDWENRSVAARIFGTGVGAPPLVSTQWSFDFLSGEQTDVSTLQNHHFLDVYRELEAHGVVGDETTWICSNYRGPSNLTLGIVGFVLPTFAFMTLTLLPFVLPVAILITFMRRRRRRRRSAQKQKTV